MLKLWNRWCFLIKNQIKTTAFLAAQSPTGITFTHNKFADLLKGNRTPAEGGFSLNNNNNERISNTFADHKVCLLQKYAILHHTKHSEWLQECSAHLWSHVCTDGTRWGKKTRIVFCFNAEKLCSDFTRPEQTLDSSAIHPKLSQTQMLCCIHSEKRRL